MTRKLSKTPGQVVVKYPPAVKADHGDFVLLHRDVIHQTQVWLDEFCQREHGFQLSELYSKETWIVRLMAIEDPTPEARTELDECLKTYREVWLPRRKALG